MSFFILQQIDTQWTKASRGGEGARRRNESPTELALPLSGFAKPAAMHILDIFEWYGFELRERVECWDSIGEIRHPFLDIQAEDNIVQVRFRRNPQNWAIANRTYVDDNGQPVLEAEAFVLRTDEWGRIRFNARFTDIDTGEWYYQHIVCNVGCFPSVQLDRFLATKPNYQFVELATLA